MRGQLQNLILFAIGLIIHQAQVCVSVVSSRDRIINTLSTVDSNAPSSKGNKFVLAFWSNPYQAVIPAPNITLFVTTDDSEPVSFTVETPNVPTLFPPRTELAVAGQTTVVTLPTSNTVPTTLSQDIRVFNKNQRDKGIRVRAAKDKRISVYGFNDEDGSSDAFLALPCIEYGENSPGDYVYYVFSANVEDATTQYSSRFMIIPCEDVTQINIIPTQTLDIPADISITGFSAQVGPTLDMKEFSVMLNALETAMFESVDDLTGTILESNKPITVFVGHECANVPSDVPSCDVLVEQVPPHITYGRFFLTSPLNYRESGELFRIGSVANDPNKVSVTCTKKDLHCPQSIVKDFVLMRGDFFEFDTVRETRYWEEISENDPYRREFCSIESSLPVTVMQYSKGHSVDSHRGDPSMLYLPPVTQYLSNHTVFYSTMFRPSFDVHASYAVASHFFQTPDTDQYFDDGSIFQPDSVNNYSPIYCSDLTTICGYGNYSNSIPQTLADDAKFFLFIYGFGIEQSFEHPADFGLEPLGLPILEIPDLSVSESVGLIQIPIRRVGGDLSLPSEIVVNFRDNGSATEQSDFKPMEQSSQHFNGHRLQYQSGSIDPVDVLVVTIIDDVISESDETFEVYLVEVHRNAHAVKPIGVVTIVDDDLVPKVGFGSTEYRQEENKRFVEIVIRTNRNKLTNGGVLFYTEDETANSTGDTVDFTAIPRGNATSVKFPIGYNPFNTILRIPINDDHIAENNESFFGRLILDPNNLIEGLKITEPTVQVTIVNDDFVFIGFDPIMYTISELDEFVSLHVKILNGKLSSDVVIQFEAIHNSTLFDENGSAQLLVFSPDVTSHSVMVPVSGDLSNLGKFTAYLSTQSNLVRIIHPLATVNIITSCFNQDVYFVVDTTLFKDSERQFFYDHLFCEQMHGVELLSAFLSERIEGCNTTSRVGLYLFPVNESSPADDMRYFKPGEQGCFGSIQNIHTLVRAVSFGLFSNNNIEDRVRGSVTLPHRVLNVVADDIEDKIQNSHTPSKRHHVVIILTTGATSNTNSSYQEQLEAAVQRLINLDSNMTIIALVTAPYYLKPTELEFFRSKLITMANGNADNTAISFYGFSMNELLLLMIQNGVLSSAQATTALDLFSKNRDYCTSQNNCHEDKGCRHHCFSYDMTPKFTFLCKVPPTNLCFVNCFADDNCTTKIALPRVTRRQCCVDSSYGMGFKVDGDDTCYACVVFGFHSTTYTAPEHVDSYSVPVGYMKNNLDATLYFNVLKQFGTASQNDFTLQSSMVRTLPQSEQPDVVRFNFRADNFAQENDETLSLHLDLVSFIDQFDFDFSRNVFFIHTLNLVILDGDDLDVQFQSEVFTSLESKLFIPVSLVLNKGIANPLTITVTPKTLTEHRLSGRPDPPGVQVDNSLSPIEANFEDFDNSVIKINLPGNCSIQYVVYVPIIDDKIDESQEQDFVVTLEIVGAYNMSRITLTRQDCICRIIDDDDIQIGFEHAAYTGLESDSSFGNVNSTVYLAKETGVFTERTFQVVVMVNSLVTSEGFQPATLLGSGQYSDYTIDDVVDQSVTLIFLAVQHRIPLTIHLFDDDIAEGMEAFQALILSSESTPVFSLPTQLSSNAVVIIEDDDNVVFGFSEINYTANEVDGFVKMCGEVQFPGENVTIITEIDISVNTDIEGTAGPLYDFRGTHGEINIHVGDKIRRSCFLLLIYNDRMVETSETFSVELVIRSVSPLVSFELDPVTATVTILGDGTATIGFINMPYVKVNENVGCYTLSVEVLTGKVIGMVEVGLSTRMNGYAYEEVDFLLMNDSRTLTFGPNTVQQNASLMIVNNQEYESKENFKVRLSLVHSSPEDKIAMGSTSVDITIIDDDFLTFYFGTDQLNVSESDGLVSITLFLTERSNTFEVHAKISTRSGTAFGTPSPEADYVTLDRQEVVFEKDSNSKEIEIEIAADNFIENSEQFSVHIADAFIGYGLHIPTDQERILYDDIITISIFDDDDVTIGFLDAETNYNVTEGQDDYINISVGFVPGFRQWRIEVLVSVQTLDNDTTVNEDYILRTKTLTFDGSISVSERQNVSIAIVDDNKSENIESFFVKLMPNGTLPHHVMLSADYSTVSITIVDDDHCGPLDNPVNGMVSYSSTMYNSTATYTCDPTYILYQSQTRICLPDKTWSGREPICERCLGEETVNGWSCLEYPICAIRGNCTGIAECMDSGNRTFVCVCPAGYKLQNDGVSCQVHSAIIATVVSAVLTLLTLTTVLAVVLYKKRQEHLKKKRARNKARANSQVYVGSPGTDFTEFSVKRSYDSIKEIHRELVIHSSNLKIQDTIGQGEFGVVYKGYLQKNFGQIVTGVVAVKTLKGFVDESLVEGLLKECVKMKKFDHPNVLSLIGVCLDGGPTPFLVMPYMVNGSLYCYLKRERSNLIIPLTEIDCRTCENDEKTIIVQKRLLDMCYQVAKGMEYLASVRFIHRDLATRNCMIDINFVIKVADFGLAEQLESKDYFRQDEAQAIKLPVKWLAPECLTDSIFSEKSDVWAFGVTCWEIFSGGKSPYTSINPAELCQMLESGYRMEKPANDACSEQLYSSVIMECWKANPLERPSFSELVEKISLYLGSLADYLDIGAFNEPDIKVPNSEVEYQIL